MRSTPMVTAFRSRSRWLCLAFVLAACGTPRSIGSHPGPSLTALASGWTKIAGGPGTECALGTPFSFFVHPGDRRRLMVYFEGGGACWDGDTCDVEGRPSFDPQVDSTDDPTRGRGILNLANTDNPVRDYTIVFVPYCTGDTFLGTRTLTYTAGKESKSPGRVFQIHHVGVTNASDALQWTYANIRDPQLVFVTGSSAGAIPSPVFAARIAGRYPKARVVQLGDAAGGYRSAQIPERLARPGTTEWLRRDKAYRSVDSTTITHTTLYIVSAREAPRATFAQYNNAQDSVQIGFMNLLGMKDVTLERLLSANLSEIRAAVPRLRTYTAPGHMHTVLLRPQFYTLTVDGVRVRDWVAGLLAGEAVGDVGNSLLSVPPR